MQSPEQQKQDDAQCSAWAVQQSGYDPAKPWFAPQASSPTPATGSSARARGAEGPDDYAPRRRDAAVAGAIVGASAQAEAGAAAAAILGRDAVNVMPGGAVAGATAQRDAARRPTLHQEQAAPQQQQAGYAFFQKARMAAWRRVATRYREGTQAPR
jgi:hypothetical protein